MLCNYSLARERDDFNEIVEKIVQNNSYSDDSAKQTYHYNEYI